MTPCSYNCGHHDCIDEKGGLGICFFCKKPVLEDDAFRFARKRGTYVAHLSCWEKRKTKDIDIKDEVDIVEEW